MKILVTGGHITPAIAVIDEIRRRYPRWEIVFVGRKKALEATTVLSEEYRILRDRGIAFRALTTGRLSRFVSAGGILSLCKVPIGMLQAFMVVLFERPRLIVSFGGYVALPIVYAAWVLGIPCVTHEQTAQPGIANQLIARVARRICVTFPHTSSLFPVHKSVVTGLPLRNALFHPPMRGIVTLQREKLLFICGGSTGAVSLNELLYPIIPELTKLFRVVHQVGRKTYDVARRVRSALPAPVRKRYTVTPYLDEEEYSWALNHATLIVGRSGANTVGEIASLGKVAIFVPLPWSAAAEQMANARWLAQAGAAAIVDQHTATADTLLATILDVVNHFDTYESNAKRVAGGTRRDGASQMVDEIARVLRKE